MAFNDSEPRDKWGMWTAGGSMGSAETPNSNDTYADKMSKSANNATRKAVASGNDQDHSEAGRYHALARQANVEFANGQRIRGNFVAQKQSNARAAFHAQMAKDHFLKAGLNANGFKSSPEDRIAKLTGQTKEQVIHIQNTGGVFNQKK